MREFEVRYGSSRTNPSDIKRVLLDPNKCPEKAGVRWPHISMIIQYSMGVAHLHGSLWDPGPITSIVSNGDLGVWEAEGRTWWCRVTDLEFVK